ncbi:MAG: hypothetical protein ABS75_20920 [Pelagibacterium sp. SCN 63-23]|nr:MAG: hypothetical protein ABS75_20920 [Pelagibacterium sp. SCN 63-23]
MRAIHKGLGGASLVLVLMAGLSAPALAQAATDIDFGDDSSEWAEDGECDDPRFSGAGAASELVDDDIARDATDCRAAFEAGTITLVEEAATAVGEPAAEAEIEFGDDSSDWARDGECDDPRFAGTGMASELLDDDIARDASDCRAAFEAGTITLAEAVPAITAIDDIDFGDDSSEWAKDQECDDPRFVGAGMASDPLDEDILSDASDCRQAYEDGTIALAEEATRAPSSQVVASVLEALANRIDFGDDSGSWPNDGDCDDPDFVGPGAISGSAESDRLGDASDCRAAFLAGTVSLKSGSNFGGPFDYGSDDSEWANDGQCDDWRFTGPGMAKKLSADDTMADASDCRALEQAGEISIKQVYQPDYVLGAPYDSSEVDFGDNSSSYSDDGQCDDPRFEGPGVATTLLDSDRMADANDCRAAFEAGTIILR